MDKIVSYCGLLCIGCPIFIATKETDRAIKAKMKIEIAKTCNQLYHTNYSAVDITDCDGCLSEINHLFPSCNDCRIRNCARIHQIPNCAYCEDYVCNTLEEFFKNNIESKSRLDFIRSIL
jgi:hypothetical protein